MLVNRLTSTTSGAMADDRIVLQCFPVSGAYHGRQYLGLAPAVLDDGGFVDPGQLLKHVLHLFWLHAETAHLELPVNPTEEGEPASVVS